MNRILEVAGIIFIAMLSGILVTMIAYGQVQTGDEYRTEICVELLNRYEQQGTPNDLCGNVENRL